MITNVVPGQLPSGERAIQLRAARDRGHTKTDWLDSRHTFSFGHYHDSRHTGFRDLLVINEDRVVPGGGFATHGHRDMEIISYVLEGALEHKDSIGTGSVIRPGEIQRMSAGTGIRHSEYNHSQSEPVHFLQIWIQPASNGLVPGYEQKSLPTVGDRSRLDLIGSPDGRDDSLTVHQDVNVYRATMRADQSLHIKLRDARHAWLQIARGKATVNEVEVAAGDGLGVSDESMLNMTSEAGAELLIFDLA